MPRRTKSKKEDKEMPPFVPLGREEDEEPGPRMELGEDGSYRMKVPRGRSTGPRPGEDTPKRTRQAAGKGDRSGQGPMLGLMLVLVFGNVLAYYTTTLLYGPFLGQNPLVLFVVVLVLAAVLVTTLYRSLRELSESLVEGITSFQRKREEEVRRARMHQFMGGLGPDDGIGIG